MGELKHMVQEFRFYSKDRSPRIFDGDASERRLMTDAMRKAAERFAEPGYRASRRVVRAAAQARHGAMGFLNRGHVVSVPMKIIFISGIRPMTEEQLSWNVACRS